MVISPLVCDPEAEEHHPPGAILRLHHISMSHTLDPVGLTPTIGVGKYRIKRTRFIRSVEIFTPPDGHAVHVFGASFSQHQIIVAIFFVNVGSLRETSAGSSPDKTLGSHCLTGLYVDFGNPDSFISLRHKIGSAIVVPEDIGVDAVDINPYGVTPRTGRIGGGTIEITPSRHVGADHIEHPFTIA